YGNRDSLRVSHWNLSYRFRWSGPGIGLQPCPWSASRARMHSPRTSVGDRGQCISPSFIVFPPPTATAAARPRPRTKALSSSAHSQTQKAPPPPPRTEKPRRDFGDGADHGRSFEAFLLAPALLNVIRPIRSAFSRSAGVRSARSFGLSSCFCIAGHLLR